MFSFRRLKPSFFYRFISLFLICTMFIFLNLNIERKKVKAIEPVTLTYSMYLLIGGLATLCGIKFASIPSEARHDFVSGGFEAIKDVGEFVFDDERGIATKLILNEATIKAFLEYAQSKEGSSFVSNFSPSVVGDFYVLPIIPSSTYKKLYTFTLSSNSVCYIYSGDSILTPISSLQAGSNVIYVTSSDGWFRVGWNSPGFNSQCNLYHSSESPSSYTLHVPFSNVSDLSVNSSISPTVLYPGSLTDVRGIEDYNKIYDRTNVGQQSIEVDGSQTGVDIATPIDSSDTFANDIVFPTGIEEGIEVPGLKINTGEGSIESAPDLSEDETLEHKGILQKVLDWLGSLLLDLMDFLLNLLDKLIDMLKSLLISLFVPSLSLYQTKELISSRLALPIFSAPSGGDINKEPFTFIFLIGSFGGVDNSDIVITLDQPWFSVIRELILGYICYLAILFIHKKLSALYGSD